MKNAYYRLIEKEETADRILQEFGLAGENVHIINGHVPVHQSAGESPVKCGGKVLIIDGGFCRAYHKETGIAGYTLIYNSYGLSLTAHEPFESTEKSNPGGEGYCLPPGGGAVQHEAPVSRRYGSGTADPAAHP